MTVTLEEAQARLLELIAKAAQGELVVITSDGKAVAHLVAIAPAEPKPKPQFGRSKGMLTILAEDDEHLKDFADYM